MIRKNHIIPLSTGVNPYIADYVTLALSSNQKGYSYCFEQVKKEIKEGAQTS